MTFFQKIQDTDNKDDKTVISKTLPNLLDGKDGGISMVQAILASLLLHTVFTFGTWLIVFILTTMGLIPSFFNRPALRNQDIEFVIVNKPEEPPINKNTPYRSDRNSRAGGINDPTKKVVEPSPAPAPGGKKTKKPGSPTPNKQQKKTAASAPAPSKQQTVQNTAPTPQTTVSKPGRAAAPKPGVPAVGKPTGQMPKAQMPKLAAAPSGPFSIGVTPNSNLPKGPVYSTGSGTSKYGGGGAPGGSGKSRVSSMPAPQFSTGKGTGSGTAAGKGSGGGGGKGGTGTGGNGIGGYGTGGVGNPGPGNPNGAPGIDAIKNPDWGPYMRELERRMKSNWNPPKGDESKRVVILFTIGRDGRLMSAPKVIKSSGSNESDLAAKKAIELTAPFKPLPPEYKSNSIDIEFTFDYNVIGARKR